MTGATEATLAELLRVAQNTNASIITLNRLIAKGAGAGGGGDSGGGGGGGGIMSTLMAPVGMAANLLGSVLKTAVGLFGDLVSGVMAVGANLVEFAKKAAMGTARLSDFYDAFKDLPFGLGLLASALAGLIKYAEEQLDAYRNVAKAGAQFGGELYAMRANASMAGMSLKDFQETINKNSQVFAQMGAGVQKGVDTFVKGMSSLWSNGGLRMQLHGLGVTAAEAGEYMATFIKSTRYSATAQGENSQTLASKTFAYILSLDQMTKLTGVHRDQLNEMVKQAADDQVWQTFLASLDPKVAEKKMLALTQATALFGKDYAEKVIRDQLMGIRAPLTEVATSAGIATGGMSIKIAKQLDDITNDMSISAEEQGKRLQRMFFDVTESSKGFTGALKGGGMAVNRELLAQLSGLLKFQNMIKASGGSFESFVAAIDSNAKQALQAAGSAAALAEVEENIRQFGNMISSLMNQLLGLLLPQLIKWAQQFLNWATIMITKYLPSVITAINHVIEIFETIVLPKIIHVFEWFGETFRILTAEDARGKFWPTLVKRIGDGFKELWAWLKPIWVNDIKPVLITVFQSLGDYLKPILERLWARIGGYIKDAINEWRNDVSFGFLGEDPEKRKLKRDLQEAQWAFADAKEESNTAYSDPAYSKEKKDELLKIAQDARAALLKASQAVVDAGMQVPNYTPTGRRAFGGPVRPGSYLVGERGPEIMNVGNVGDVISNDNIRRIAAEKPAAVAIEELNNTMKQILRYAISTADNTGRTVGAVARIGGNIMPTI